MKETMNDPYHNDEYAETEFTEEKKFPWKMINCITAVILLLFGNMALIVVPGTSFVSFSIAFVLWLALCIVNLLLRDHKRLFIYAER